MKPARLSLFSRMFPTALVVLLCCSIVFGQGRPVVQNNATLVVPAAGGQATLGGWHMTVGDDEPAGNITFQLYQLPARGTLRLSGVALESGDRFTQEDINNLLVAYHHGGGTGSSDVALMDVSDNSGNTLRDVSLSITILQLDQSLEGHWKLDEAAGSGGSGIDVGAYQISGTAASLALDSSGNGRDANVVAPRWTQDGYLDGALWPDGAQTYADAPATGISGNVARSVCGWVYYDGTDQAGAGEVGVLGFLPASPSARDSFSLEIHDNAGADVWVWSLGVERFAFPILEAGWNHFALCYEDRELRGYLNGHLVIWERIASFEPALSTVDDFLMASRPDTGGLFMGRLDEVRVYSRALAPAEAAALSQLVPRLERNERIPAVAGNGTVISREYVRVVDDAGPSVAALRLDVAPEYGVLTREGVSLVQGDTFTQEEINAGFLEYVASGGRRNWDAFEVTPQDGSESGLRQLVHVDISDSSYGSIGDYVFVENGEKRNVRVIGRAWQGQPGFLECSPGGTVSQLFGGVGMGSGDFQLEMRLALQQISGGSGARVCLGDYSFEFDGSDGHMRVSGRDITTVTLALLADYVASDTPFDFDVVRSGGSLQFLINNVQVHSMSFDTGPVGYAAIVPWENTLRVYAMQLTGPGAPLSLPPAWEYSHTAAETLDMSSAHKALFENDVWNLLEMAPVVLPEGSNVLGVNDHFSHPVAAMVGDHIALAYTAKDWHDGNPRYQTVVVSEDGGDSWSAPVRAETLRQGFSGGETQQSMLAIGTTQDRQEFLLLAAKQGFFRSADGGRTWAYQPESYTQSQVGGWVSTPGPRIVAHPSQGLLVFSGNRTSSTNYYRYSLDNGWNWQTSSFDMGASYMIEPAGLVFQNETLLTISREHKADFGFTSNPDAIHYTQHLSLNGSLSNMTASTTNIAADWSEANTFWNQDTVDVSLNPVTERVEVIAVNRNGSGVVGEETGNMMSLSIFSISQNALLSGSSNWRYEGTLMMRNLIARTLEYNGVDVSDAYHPAAAVIDAGRGVQHIFFYAGIKGKSGIFRLTRSLNTPYLRAYLLGERFPAGVESFWQNMQ